MERIAILARGGRENRKLAPNVDSNRKRKESARGRIIAGLQEAVDWVEGRDVAVRVFTVEVPIIDVCETRRHLGVSQAAFAAKFGFQPATLLNWKIPRPAAIT